MFNLSLRFGCSLVACYTMAYATHAQYAAEVVAYSPGQGVSSAFTNAVSALGEPSRITPDPFGGPVDPFDPPYKPAELVSLGSGGSLTLRFRTPVLNHPLNRYGIDFIIFGNAGFVITNEFDLSTFDWIGTPATDGSLLGANPGDSKVSVSRDGVTWYVLDPTRAPLVDGFAPTDGIGDFHIPVDPVLTTEDFAGTTLEQIRALYNGSAGGSGYDISWAQDENGQPVFLPLINYVRIEEFNGRAEIDGVASVFTATKR